MHRQLAITSLAISLGLASAAASAAQNSSSPQPGPSCNGRPGAGNDCQGKSCCDRIQVPAGSFQFTPPGSLSLERSRVKSFYLDRYEATVGRFKAWAEAGSPLPKTGTVMQRDLRGKPIRWSAAASASTQRGAKLAGWHKYDTWSANMYRSPKNNINWYTAAAFCHWDGGRLPTEKEWQYAAVGGEQGRLHPWGDAAPTFDHAVYNCHGDGNKSCNIVDLLAVGSKPKGAARWGHMDMAGSVFEWSVTYQGSPDMLEGRSNGGGFCYIGGVDRRAPAGLKATTARLDSLTEIGHTVGVRCAYDLPKPVAVKAADKPAARKRSSGSQPRAGK